MKKQLLFIFLHLSVLSFGQNFAPVGAVWHYGEAFPFSPGQSFFKFESVQDSLFQGENCRLIHKNDEIECEQRALDVLVYEEDSVVYFWDYRFDEFQILYDFKKQIGESWIVKVKDTENETDTIVAFVNGISTYNANGHTLIKMEIGYTAFFSLDSSNFTRNWNGVIIEKIGDLAFMFNYFSVVSEFCDMNVSTGLRCYEDSELGFYTTNPNKACDYNSLSIEENNLENLIISPNPSNGKFKINSDLKLNKVYVYNSLGILEGVYDFSGEINLSSLNPGIYFLEFEFENETELLKGKIVLE